MPGPCAWFRQRYVRCNARMDTDQPEADLLWTATMGTGTNCWEVYGQTCMPSQLLNNRTIGRCLHSRWATCRSSTPEPACVSAAC